MEPSEKQGTVPADEEGPPRLPPMGALGALPPLHTTQYAIETNVSRIATQIAEGRTPTYD